MRNRRFFLLGIALVPAMLTVLLFLCAGASLAKPPPIQPASLLATDPDRMIWDAIGINAADEMYPDVAYNSQDDEYLVVFERPDPGGIGRDIMSIQVDASGQAALWPYGVAITSTYTDTHPAVAYNPTNNTYLVVWERSPGYGGKDIMRAVLHAGGSISETEYTVAGWDGDQQSPDVAYSAVDDRYLVVWEDHYPYLTDGPDIYGRVLDGLGLVQGAADVTDLNASGAQTYPAVAANTDSGGWLVTWRDSRDLGTTGYDVYGQRMSVSGSTLSTSGPQVAIGTLPGYAGAPDVIWGQPGSGDGAFLTVWDEDSVLYGQRVAADSTLTGDTITVSDYESSKSVPAVAFDSIESAWWVVWADNRDYG